MAKEDSEVHKDHLDHLGHLGHKDRLEKLDPQASEAKTELTVRMAKMVQRVLQERLVLWDPSASPDALGLVGRLVLLVLMANPERRVKTAA